MGTTGIGTEAHFNLAIIGAKEKINIVTVPFDGGAPYTAAILGGHVDVAAGQLSPQSQVGPHIKSGALRGLMTTSKTRHPDFPDIPTATELGYPEANINNWYAIFGPAGIPQSAVDTLVPALQKAFKDPSVLEQCRKAGFLVDFKGPDEFRKDLESELQTIGKLAKELGLAK
jgi:tripartite-type tricarboxylate transporter receptor subunit TctC